MPRHFDGGRGHRGYRRDFGRGFGFDGFGFGGPFLGGLAGGLLGSVLFPGDGYGRYPQYYGGYPPYGGYPYYPYGYPQYGYPSFYGPY